jgi:hypothetical protein
MRKERDIKGTYTSHMRFNEWWEKDGLWKYGISNIMGQDGKYVVFTLGKDYVPSRDTSAPF